MVSGIRIGIQLGDLKMPFKQALHTAARLGVRAVEIDARNGVKPSEISGTALRQVRKMLTDLDLRVVAVRFSTRRGYGDLDELDRRVAATKEAMRMAYDLGANCVINQIGTVAKDPMDESHTILRGVLNDLGRFGQHVGAILACESGSEPLTHLVDLIEALPEASLGIALNPGNLLVNGFDLNDLSKGAKHVVVVHARDGVRDLARGRGVEVPLGRGLAEFPQIAATLEECHFPGYYIVDRESLANPVQDIAQAIDFLRNM